jgi:hypothetical protein
MKEVFIAAGIAAFIAYSSYHTGYERGHNAGFSKGVAEGKLLAPLVPPPAPTPAKPRIPFWRDGKQVDECGDPIPFREMTDEEFETSLERHEA